MINTHGIKSVVNVFFHIKVEEMPTLSITIPMAQLMSDYGKSITSIGDSVVREKHLVILKSTLIVQLIFINGVETHSNYGIPTQLVDVDIIHSKEQFVNVYFISYLFLSFSIKILSYGVYKKGFYNK